MTTSHVRPHTRRIHSTMGRDSDRSHIHMRDTRTALFFEEWVSTHLPDGKIDVKSLYQPINPEDEDDIVPDQHAAFAISLARSRNGVHHHHRHHVMPTNGPSMLGGGTNSGPRTVSSALWRDLDLQALYNVPPTGNHNPDDQIILPDSYRILTSGGGPGEFFRERLNPDGLDLDSSQLDEMDDDDDNDTLNGDDSARARTLRYPVHRRAHGSPSAPGRRHRSGTPR
ncbi:uncharacterized protein V1510DRAFT_412104 [Dipodascopsis tothii]|uniref:uncharacterized protein n=1 Tax=Dipodascopsis tothii TaxID=44089 RepID=UPI0034CD0B26